LFVSLLPFANAYGQAAPATQPAQTPAAESRIVAVTVYQGSALVTREVRVKEGTGLVEVVVGPLPPQTIDSSLFTESGDGIRVLTTRYRTRAVQEDTQTEVRAREDHVRQLTAAIQDLQKQLEVLGQDQQLLNKLEQFTAATMQQLTDKGQLNAESTIKLASYVMERRSADGKEQVKLQQQVQTNQAQIEFLQRQVSELATGSNRTEREAVIVADKANAAVGTVRLNYLVSSADWQPQYKLRAGGERDPLQVEYLASIEQRSGEDWNDVDLVLSTATPRVNAAPPELLALEISVAGPQAPLASAMLSRKRGDVYRDARNLRQQAQQELSQNRVESAGGILNSAAAAEQFGDIVAKDDSESATRAAEREGPSVAYHLDTRLSVPSRNDQQLVEVARLEMQPKYFYKTVPVLSPHVYRQAELTNSTRYVLLPGEATMYVGTDFVGRMRLPLVAIGETFTAGFGIDPQIQVARELVARNKSIQGGNQVQTFQYRIRISSYKPAEVRVQVWDRLPHGESEAVAVELVRASPDLSTGEDYLRTDRPKNLLRWDLPVKPNAGGAEAATISYEFKLQFDRNVGIANFQPAPR
jgi:uncharacterized protein (TIGR02231 family)